MVHVPQGDRDLGAPGPRAGIQGILQQFEWPATSRRMTASPRFVHARANAPSLVTAVLLFQRFFVNLKRLVAHVCS
jgi:hypothetical protein